MRHDLSDIESAMDYVSCIPDMGNSAFLCRQTGRLYYLSEFGDCEDEAPEDLYENDAYIAIPNKYDLDLGTSLVHRFIRLHAIELTEEVERIFSRKGAYARFRTLLAQHRLVDQWHAFENTQTRDAIKKWCEDNQIELSQTPGS